MNSGAETISNPEELYDRQDFAGLLRRFLRQALTQQHSLDATIGHEAAHDDSLAGSKQRHPTNARKNSRRAINPYYFLQVSSSSEVQPDLATIMLRVPSVHSLDIVQRSTDSAAMELAATEIIIRTPLPRGKRITKRDIHRTTTFHIQVSTGGVVSNYVFDTVTGINVSGHTAEISELLDAEVFEVESVEDMLKDEKRRALEIDEWVRALELFDIASFTRS